MRLVEPGTGSGFTRARSRRSPSGAVRSKDGKAAERQAARGPRRTMRLGLGALMIWGPIRGAVQRSTTVSGLAEWLRFTGTQATAMFVRLAALAAILAAADVAMAKFRTGRSLKMTKQETRQENKEEEGNPLVRSHRRRRHAQLARHNMIRETPPPDVVLTNPTHLALALPYPPNKPPPPLTPTAPAPPALNLRAP